MRRECWRDCAEKGVVVILNSPSGEGVGEKWNNYSGLKGMKSIGLLLTKSV